jgi:hypothetical protein
LLAIIGIAVAIGNVNSKSSDGVDKINELSDEIYKLNEKAQAINKITDSFDKLDNKLIKTKADLEEMNSLLEQGAEIMDDTAVDKKKDIGFGKGKNEKDFYNSLDDKGKELYLKRKQEATEKELEKNREKQKDAIYRMSASERKTLFDENSTDADAIRAQSAIYALNNAELYKYIDSLKEAGKVTENDAQETETLTQSLLEGLSAEEA